MCGKKLVNSCTLYTSFTAGTVSYRCFLLQITLIYVLKYYMDVIMYHIVT